MLSHTIETCPDDLTLLQQRLDALTHAGARILAVIWRQQRVTGQDQSAAFDASGSYVIICESAVPEVLRERDIALPQDMPAEARV
jgi:hypothetical protein